MAIALGDRQAPCCTAGLATIKAIEQDDPVEDARRVGAYLRDGLGELQEKHPPADECAAWE